MRDHITTAFEVVGLLLLVVAAGMYVTSVVSTPAGLATAGVLSLGCSAVIVRSSPKPARGPDGGEVA